MEKAIIIDIDMTIADLTHRLSLGSFPVGQGGQKEVFYEAAKNDAPIFWSIDLIKAMQAKGKVLIFMTGRYERHRKITAEWLAYKARLSGAFILYMRPEGDTRKDYEIKKEIYETKIKGKYEVLFALDDRTKVVEMWRSIGVPCLQCREDKTEKG